MIQAVSDFESFVAIIRDGDCSYQFKVLSVMRLLHLHEFVELSLFYYFVLSYLEIAIVNHVCSFSGITNTKKRGVSVDWCSSLFFVCDNIFQLVVVIYRKLGFQFLVTKNILELETLLMINQWNRIKDRSTLLKVTHQFKLLYVQWFNVQESKSHFMARFILSFWEIGSVTRAFVKDCHILGSYLDGK